MLFDLLASIHSWLRPGDAGGSTARTDGGQVAGTTTADGVDTEATTINPEVDDGDDGHDTEGDGHDAGEFDMRGQVLLSGIPQAAFVIDIEGAIRAWNHDMTALTGVDAEEARGRDDIGMLLYDSTDDTMIEKVLAEPTTADEVYGLTVEDESRHLYAKEDRIADHSGNVERYAKVTVMPVYDDGELVGAVEMVQDLTEERRQQEATEALVDEVSGTLQALTTGELGARASFDDTEFVDDRLLGVVEDVNGMADNLQDVVRQDDQQASRLADSVERAVSAADGIATNVDDQNELLAESVDEMQTFSASMEEVAATAEQVDSAAETAREASNEGLAASEDAHTAATEVTELGEELVDSVTDLGERMDDIENVVEVISDVAEQTNLLALNANIEAARAGEAGDGFEVVADEVKNLADETRQHTEEITKSINDLQSQADSTITAAEESHQQIDTAGDQIDDVLTAFEDIAAAVDQAADGIAEVSRATDDQAATVEELTSTLEEARDHASETDAAAENIVAATDEQTDAIAELEDRVHRLRNT